jgi:hypothetical protein
MCQRRFTTLIAAATMSLVPCAAHAWEFRTRFVERVDMLDIPLDNDAIDASNLEPRRIRIQFGVFDDDQGPAPAGGFVSCSQAIIDVSGPPDNSQERRTRGRVAPFTFSQAPLHNGVPEAPGLNNPNWPGDPPNGDFQRLTNITADVGTQSPFWRCNPDGTPAPMPPAATWGLNAYESVYEITINPHPGAVTYFINFSGGLIAASDWRVVGNPVPPDCGDPATPDDDVPGQVTYAPFPLLPSTPFETVLTVIVPGPPSAIVLGCICVAARRSRRPPVMPEIRS